MFYVNTCGEFPSLGTIYEFENVEDAVVLYDTICKEYACMIPSIEIELPEKKGDILFSGPHTLIMITGDTVASGEYWSESVKTDAQVVTAMEYLRQVYSK